MKKHLLPTAAMATPVPLPLHFVGKLSAFVHELKRLQRLR